MSKSKVKYTVGVKSLRSICPTLSQGKAKRIAESLGTAMHRFGITNEWAAAHFIAQCAHESGEFRWSRELWGPTPTQAGYWKRRDIQGDGALWPGLGYAARGGGWIQTTGRVNFKRAAQRLGRKGYLWLAALSGTRQYASLLAAIWWADAMPHRMAGMTVTEVTHRVNGGENGLSERIKYFERARGVRGWLVPVRVKSR